MGTRGPKNQPVAVLKAKGTLNVTRTKDVIADANAYQWVYENDFPMPPEHLVPDAQAIWTKMLMQAAKLYGYISYIDLSMFEEYCYVYAEMEFLKNETRGQRTYADENGVMRINPLYLELNKIRKDWVRLSQLFGFDPSSRTRINLEQKAIEVTDKWVGGI